MLILNVQYWQGDRDQAMALARLIADLEDNPRTDCMMMFTARFDCDHDEETIAYVSNKFQVLKYKTKRNATGWPNGPNQMMGCSYEHCVELKLRGKLPKLKAVMMIEADCVPLYKNWLDQLIAEWNGCGKHVLGAWLKKGDAGCEHVNGNCIMSIDFWKKFRSIMHPPSRGGWDAVLSYGILPNAVPSKLIWSDYRLGTNDNPWKNCNYLWEDKEYKTPSNPLFSQKLKPVWFHGIKSLDGIRCVRQKLLNEEVPKVP